MNEIYILNLLLLPLSILYLSINYFKKYFFLNKKPNLIPVIVVGNLTLGGTGKTSFVIWLCNYLSLKKYNIGVISGGYKTIAPKFLEIVNNFSDPLCVGDEAILIKKKTNAIVCKCKNRKLAYEYLVNNFNLDIIISDDGLIHYSLNRNLNIVLLNENRPFGNKLIFPAGPLRESSNSINKYSFIIFNKKKESDLRGFYYDNTKIISFLNSSEKSINYLRKKKVHLVTAIASPEILINNLIECEISLIIHTFPDHYLYTHNDFQFNDNNIILMTEKDFIKCKDFNLSEAYYLPPKIIVDNDIKIMLNKEMSNLLKRYKN